MAILVQMAMPDGVPLEMLDAVNAEMNAEADPPAGLIVHAAYFDGSRIRIVDVWESKEPFDQFGQNRLGPAIGKVAARLGVDPGEPESTIVELHEVVRGR